MSNFSAALLQKAEPIPQFEMFTQNLYQLEVGTNIKITVSHLYDNEAYKKIGQNVGTGTGVPVTRH
jgi:hypothetical protein